MKRLSYTVAASVAQAFRPADGPPGSLQGCATAGAARAEGFALGSTALHEGAPSAFRRRREGRWRRGSATARPGRSCRWPRTIRNWFRNFSVASAEGISASRSSAADGARKVELAVEILPGDAGLDACEPVDEPPDADVTDRRPSDRGRPAGNSSSRSNASRAGPGNATDEPSEAAASCSSDCGLKSGRTSSSIRRPPKRGIEQAVDRVVARIRLVARQIERAIDGERQRGVDAGSGWPHALDSG